MVRVAIMGATGAVGLEFINILEQRGFPCASIKFLASERSKGRKLLFRGRMIEVEVLSKESFKDVDLVLASAGGEISKVFAPIAVESGAVIVDNTSYFRMQPDVPLVVPEVNAHAIEKHKGIISNPNCSTIQMVVVLNPIQKKIGIKRVVVSTYQSVSGKGLKAIYELCEQTKKILSGDTDLPIKQFPHQIAFNCLPHIDSFLDSGAEKGYTKEEIKMVNETKKIMEAPEIAITATTVRVPVIKSHSESVNIQLKRKASPEEIREILSNAPGVIVVDNPSKNEYPMPIYAEGRDETFVGRIRQDISLPDGTGIDMWIVSDNIRKGAALNAIQIAEILIQKNLLRKK